MTIYHLLQWIGNIFLWSMINHSHLHRGRISLFKLSYGERIANLAVHHNAKEQHRTFPSYIKKKKPHSKYESYIVTESNKVLNLFFFCNTTSPGKKKKSMRNLIKIAIHFMEE